MKTFSVDALRVTYEARLHSNKQQDLSAKAELEITRDDGVPFTLPIKIASLGMLMELQQFFSADLPTPTDASTQVDVSSEDSVPEGILQMSQQLAEQQETQGLRVVVAPHLDEADEANAGLRSI